MTIGPKSNKRKIVDGTTHTWIGIHCRWNGMLVCPILNIAKLFGSLLVHWRMQSAPEVSMRWPPTPLRPSDPLPTRQPRLLLGCRVPLLSWKPDCARAWMSSVLIDAGAKIGREYSPCTFTQLPLPQPRRAIDCRREQHNLCVSGFSVQFSTCFAVRIFGFQVVWPGYGTER